MTQSVLEQMGVQIDETAHKASRAACAVADALEDGGKAARCMTKKGSRAATELIDDTRKRVQRHPLKTVAATLVAGIGAGAVIGWTMRHKQRSSCADVQESGDVRERGDVREKVR
jgi:ElaB/YqjD/DUF883 family membrane-anchored ribosome-binding protein